MKLRSNGANGKALSAKIAYQAERVKPEGWNIARRMECSPKTELECWTSTSTNYKQSPKYKYSPIHIQGYNYTHIHPYKYKQRLLNYNFPHIITTLAHTNTNTKCLQHNMTCTRIQKIVIATEISTRLEWPWYSDELRWNTDGVNAQHAWKKERCKI